MASMNIKEIIIKELKEHDTIIDYMTEEEAVEYYKEQYAGDYNKLIKQHGE